jgi:hypothetical protein
MTEVTTISTKDTAAMLRGALRTTFPGVKFSVRISRGTAYGWLDVSWEDGPTMRQVDEVAGRYEGSRFDGMDDAYHRVPNSLVAFAGEELPREVRYRCRGINSHRSIGRQGYATLVEVLNAAQPGVTSLRDDGMSLHPGMLEDDVAAQLQVLPGPVDVQCAAWRLHCRIDFTRG